MAELLHAAVLSGQAGMQAAESLAAVNRALIGHHEAEVGRLAAMNEQIARSLR